MDQASRSSRGGSEVILRNLGEAFARHPDRLSGIFLAVIAGIAMYQASHLPFGSIAAPDSGFFPISLSTLLFLFACVVVLNSFISTSPPLEFGARSASVVLAACAFVIYAIAIPKAGFVISTTAILLLLMRGFGGVGWARSFLVSLVLVLLTYFAFLELGVPLPAGPLPF
jgi:putative tricarboxylic transport membrane protein